MVSLSSLISLIKQVRTEECCNPHNQQTHGTRESPSKINAFLILVPRAPVSFGDVHHVKRVALATRIDLLLLTVTDSSTSTSIVKAVNNKLRFECLTCNSYVHCPSVCNLVHLCSFNIVFSQTSYSYLVASNSGQLHDKTRKGFGFLRFTDAKVQALALRLKVESLVY